ncbi:hypothetical protein [Streptomyces acidicola]|uniref:hypothetical protein n=1 Tax=Streptomyces acidicola TaxID=2596892 RepID=UPI00342D7CB8
MRTLDMAAPAPVVRPWHLTIRRSLGCKLKVEGRMLGQFVGFLEEHGDSRLTVQAALEWAVLPHSADPARWAARLTVIREFARFLAAFDELTEIPPLRSAGRTTPPYPYSQAEITALIQTARSGPPSSRGDTNLARRPLGYKRQFAPAKHPLGSGLWPCQAGELSAAADWCPRLHPLVDHLYISMYRNK